MKKRNEKFFAGKTWEQVFKELNFTKHYEKLCKTLSDKKVLFYGAGLMFDYFSKNYDLSKLNIIGIADKKFEINNNKVYNGLNAIKIDDVKKIECNCIVITTQYPVEIRNYIKRVIYKNVKCPRIYFLLNKPFMLYLEEIWE